MKRTCLLLLSALILATGLFAQEPKLQLPQASPASTLKQTVGLTDIEITYARPGVKGREIFGKLVPLGAVWRTGANTATGISFSTPVTLNGTLVAAGTYGLFTIPGETEWTIIINKDSKQWGAYKYDEKNDVVRFKATPVKLSESVETFTIDVSDVKLESATLNLTWDKTRVPVKIEVATIAKAIAQIEAGLAVPGNRPAGFFGGAVSFCINNNVELTKALAWANTGITQNPKAFQLIQQKAVLQSKLGDKAGALETAKLAAETAKAAGGNNVADFLKQNEAFIAGLK